MSWDLETAKIYLGIDPGDETKDDQIQGILDYTLKAVETLLQRKLLFARETVKFLRPRGDTILLPRWPVDTIVAINDADPPVDMEINEATGYIRDPGFSGEKEISVEYDGGYDPLPTDLERVLWEAFMTAWGNTDAETGGPAGPGTGVIAGSGDVKSLTVFDAFKMDYDVGTTSTGDGQSSLISQQSSWGWLAPWAAILEMYRGEFGTGGLGVV